MSQLIHRRQTGPLEVDEPTESAELRLPERTSLVLMLLCNLLLQVSFFIVVSSSSAYAEHLGGNATFSGVVIGIPTVFAGLALIPMMRYDGGGYRRPLHGICASAILGHVIYALAYRANFLYLILLGRMVNGLAFTGFMYTKRYCTDARFVGMRRRTTLASFLVIGQGVGMSAGPFLGGLLFKVGFSNRIFNGFSSPAWFMAGVWAIFWLCLAKWYRDPVLTESSINMGPQLQAPLSMRITVSTQTAVSPPIVEEPRMSLPQWGVSFTMCWFAMTCFFILGAWEANLPVFGAPGAGPFKWSPTAAGNFIGLGGITALPFLLLNVFLAPRVQDRKILAFGSGLGAVGLVVFAALLGSGAHTAQNPVSYGSLFACWWAIALGFNMASTVTVSLLSKQLPPEWNKWTSLAIQYSNYTGRVTGAVWGGSGLSVGMLNYVGLELGVVGFGALCFVGLWRDLKAKKG